MNIEEFASLIGVSRTAVSYAIHGTGRLSPTTREMILSRMDELGYRPNRVARALVTGRTNMAAFWTPDSRNPFYVQVAYHTQNELRKHRLDMITREIPDTHFRGELPGTSSPQWPVDGVIAVDADRWLPSFLKDANDPNVPVVNMGVYFSEITDYVGIDLLPAAMKAVRHLIDLGCRHIVYLSNPTAAGLKDSRVDAYYHLAKEHGFEPRFITASGPFRTAVRDAVSRFVEAKGQPCGIFCHSDYLAMGAYRALCDLGLRVPEDVAIVSCDGIEDIEYLETPLSTIVQPIEEMARLACDFLHRRIQDPSTPRQQAMLQGEFLIRASSGG